MDPPKPFPILRLPYLAMEEIFKAMDPIEITNFSMISKRTKYLVSCAFEMTSGQQMEETAEGDGYILRRVFKYLKNPMEKWKQLCKYVLDIFKKPETNGVSMTMDASVDFFFIARCSPISRLSICSSELDPPKSFPILRLPFLAIEEIFKAMHPIEIINFSMTSKRAKAVTKIMTFYSKYAICLCVDKTMGISIKGTDNLVSCTYVMISNERMDGITKEDESYGYISRRVFKYSKDPVDDWRQLYIYVLEIFKKQTIDVLSMTMDAFVDQNVSIIDFVKTNAKSVSDCHLYQLEEKNDVDEHAAYLLENLKIDNQLISYLYIKTSEWIGFERLLEIDCKSVLLRNDPFWEEDWNLFLKTWIAMDTHLNLEYLALEYRDLDYFRNHVLYDIPHEVVDRGVKRVLKTGHNQTQEISGGVDIRRIDGKTATFFSHSNSFSMSVH
ncbi:hypothetical protein CRE_09810 [Caenorhabditis remanei]|uniref:F-box domain-containing protein n=1 Tax=Caenorhabditis remanei TaxID=31234 RepID=E3NDH9_CAERE|nr:hypothetical protein CRE_09810 [Caenorhabditis remanei]